MRATPPATIGVAVVVLLAVLLVGVAAGRAKGRWTLLVAGRRAPAQVMPAPRAYSTSDRQRENPRRWYNRTAATLSAST
jgi:hypothetical protein